MIVETLSAPATAMTGLERITRLETKIEGFEQKLDEAVASIKSIESLLLQGRGAVNLTRLGIRVGRYGLTVGGLVGIGALLRDKLHELLSVATK